MQVDLQRSRTVSLTSSPVWSAFSLSAKINVMDNQTTRKNRLETVEPIGKRVLLRKDEDKKQTRSGIHLPDKMEIPTLTGRIVAVSAEVASDANYPIEQYDRVLFNPKDTIPVDFEGDNRLFVVPVENIVAVFRMDR